MPRERKEFAEEVQQLPSPCSDVAVPLAQCVLEKRNCAKCVPAARFVMKQVRAGKSSDQVEDVYKNRYDASRLKTIPIDGSPAKGPSDAPVVLVEFADFECPTCQAVAPYLDKIIEARKDKILFVYKLIALSMHPRAEPAARAAIAAMMQGKFWEYHDRLFETHALEPSDLDKAARALGLDLVRFAKDQTSPTANDRFERDRKLFDDVGCQGTPTIFVNGRQVEVTDLDDWIDEELGGGAAPASSGTKATPPAPSGSTAPSASARVAGGASAVPSGK
jgi:protein-disulfide isomerase